jgi:hypothetical protein
MRIPRLVVLTATMTLLSATAYETAKAEVCRLVDGREFSTNHMGDIVSPTELVGFRLRERDDLQGFEIFRLFSDVREVMLVASCTPGFDFGGPGGFGVQTSKRGDRDGGRDSGGNCDSKNDPDSSCSE